MRTPAELTDAFRARGLKLTPQRQLLFTLLHGNTEHPSAEALHALASAHMPGISLRTVYHTLSDLADMGELRVVNLGVGPARFDPNVDHHHHARCTVCGTVFDVYVVGLHALQMDGVDGFVASSAHLILDGTCGGCSAG